MDRLPKKNTEDVRKELKDLFRIHDIEAARVTKMKILNKFEILRKLSANFERFL